MANRRRDAEKRVRVAVSPEMLSLRRSQVALNGFWQTSELAYGYFLTDFEQKEINPTRLTSEVLGYIESEVWYPNNQGRIKHTDTMGSTLTRIRGNTTYVYRATLVSFFSAFELFLESRVDHLKPPKIRWGEYVRSLVAPEFREAPCPLPLRAILCADLCREVRNQIVHESSVPSSRGAECLSDWRSRLYKRTCESGWSAVEAKAALDFSFEQVVGQAIRHVEEAQKDGKALPIELFYMLFAFTNLDTLAFVIEEALLPPNFGEGKGIYRKEKAVRRSDLILESEPK